MKAPPIALFLLLANTSLAAEVKSPQWYEIATDVLAIPAAIIGLCYSIILIQKTRLESAKLKIEIQEKESELSNSPQPTLSRTSVPESSTTFVHFLLMRFIILFLMIQAWGILESGLDFVFMGAAYGLSKLGSGSLGPEQWWFWPVYLLSKTPTIIYWFIFAKLAWPIFQDASRLVNIDWSFLPFHRFFSHGKKLIKSDTHSDS